MIKQIYITINYIYNQNEVVNEPQDMLFGYTNISPYKVTQMSRYYTDEHVDENLPN